VYLIEAPPPESYEQERVYWGEGERGGGGVWGLGVGREGEVRWRKRVYGGNKEL